MSLGKYIRYVAVASGVIVLGMLSAQSALGDRGSIPFKPGVQVFEPNQRAMIAWNGEEEILLLSTDLRASEPTQVLEVLPLPAEPEVTRGDVAVFRKATDLINSKLARGRGAEPAARSGEVTFHKRIGAHDISVTRVLDRNGFVRWVEGYLQRSGVDNPTIPPPLAAVIGDYLDDGYGWFVFDVVDLGRETLTNDAIQYRFASKFLYYPLRITRAEAGETSIRLFVLTPTMLSQFPGLPVREIHLLHEPVALKSGELRSLSKDMDALLDHREDMQLRIWQIRGRLSEFQYDLIATDEQPLAMRGVQPEDDTGTNLLQPGAEAPEVRAVLDRAFQTIGLQLRSAVRAETRGSTPGVLFKFQIAGVPGLEWSGFITGRGSITVTAPQAGAKMVTIDYGDRIFTWDNRDAGANVDRFIAPAEGPRKVLTHFTVNAANRSFAADQHGKMLRFEPEREPQAYLKASRAVVEFTEPVVIHTAPDVSVGALFERFATE